jgi:hypothetical protein
MPSRHSEFTWALHGWGWSKPRPSRFITWKWAPLLKAQEAICNGLHYSKHRKLFAMSSITQSTGSYLHPRFGLDGCRDEKISCRWQDLNPGNRPTRCQPLHRLRYPARQPKYELKSGHRCFLPPFFPFKSHTVTQHLAG